MKALVDSRIAYWVGAVIGLWLVMKFGFGYGPFICL
jgi:hypothetical protein